MPTDWAHAAPGDGLADRQVRRARRTFPALAGLIRSLACGWTLTMFAPATWALDVISHLSVTLSKEEVRDVYLGEKLYEGNIRLVPVQNAALENEFLSLALQTDRAKFDARWARQRSHYGLHQPVSKSDDADVIAYVRATPGAIGYVRKAPTGVAVLHRY